MAESNQISKLHRSIGETDGEDHRWMAKTTDCEDGQTSNLFLSLGFVLVLLLILKLIFFLGQNFGSVRS